MGADDDLRRTTPIRIPRAIVRAAILKRLEQLRANQTGLVEGCLAALQLPATTVLDQLDDPTLDALSDAVEQAVPGSTAKRRR